jgi:proline iminopeptidase
MEHFSTISGSFSSSAGDSWYEICGEFSSQSVPLVLIHGGPGFTSYYLEPLRKVADTRPVVFLDQAGCGRARNKGARKLFTVESFVEEVEALRRILGVSQLHLFGHSFGGLIAGEYALRYPEYVKSIMFACVSIDIPRWRDDADRLRSTLPLMTRMILREGDRTQIFDSSQYIGALGEYYQRFVYRFNELDEKPDVIALSEREADPTTYLRVWGPNELVINGEVKDYSLTPRLPQIVAPTLFLCGRYDEATPEAHEYFASQVVGARCMIFERSAHHPQLTETVEFLATVTEFLVSVSAE